MRTPDGNGKRVRPKDASTLIVVRRGVKPRILMGKRAPTNLFMPNKFVFPGGGLELCDQRLKVTQELNFHVMKRLKKGTSKRFSSERVRGLALAAIRETYEETGLIIGHKTREKFVTANKVWQSYFSYGVEPPLDQLDFIARAITPSKRSRRFDTRFFMVYDDPRGLTRIEKKCEDQRRTQRAQSARRVRR